MAKKGDYGLSELDDDEPVYEDSNVPFQVLMQRAANMKSKQGEVFRRKYDSWPAWYQHSMFAKDDIVGGRTLLFHERLKMATSCKLKGNNSLKEHDIYDAMHEYERALSLFKWVENTKDDWKKKEIEDEFLIEHKFEPVDDSEGAAIEALECSCLLNLAAVYIKLCQWNDCIKACNHVLEIRPSSAKAYYRRAQARLLPMSCGTTDNEMALRDLRRAQELQPDDPLIARAFLKLKSDLARQKRKDLAEFGGLFERGVVIHPEDEIAVSNEDTSTKASNSISCGNGMTVQEGLRSVRDMESVAERYYRDGHVEESEQLLRRAVDLKREIEEFAASSKKEKCQSASSGSGSAEKKNQTSSPLGLDWSSVDFSHPSEEVVATAREVGLDLHDPRVVTYMQGLQEEMLSQATSENKSDLHLSETSMQSALTRLQLKESRKTAEFLCSQWDDGDIILMLEYRLKYMHSCPRIHSEDSDVMRDCNAALAEYESAVSAGVGEAIRNAQENKHLLVECVGKDIFCMEKSAVVGEESNKDDVDGIFAMLNERYGIQEVEKLAAKRESQNRWRTVTIYSIGAVLLILFLLAHYNKLCRAYCSRDYCAPDGVCSLHMLLFSSDTSDPSRGAGEGDVAAALPNIEYSAEHLPGENEFEF